TLKRYIHVLLPLFIGSIIAYLDRVNIAYAALTMNQDLQFTPEIFGMGAGIFFIGYILFEIPGAIIAEKWNPKGWLMRIMITWGIVSFLMIFITRPWHFYTLRFLLGSAEASFYPVLYASVIPRWFTLQERPKAIALMLTSLQVSAIIGSPLAGFLLDVSLFGLKGWQLLFVCEAIPALFFGILLYFILSNDPMKVSWLSDKEKEYLLNALSDESKQKTQHYTIWQALKDKEVLKLALIYFLWITGFWGFNYWMPTVIKELSGWSNITIGSLFAIPMTVSLIVMVYIGYSSSKTGEKRLHGAIPLAIAALGLGAGVFIQDPVVNMLFVCIAAIGIFGPFGVWWSYPTTFLSGAAAAGAVGLINSSGNIGGYVGPYLIGIIKNLTNSFELSFLILAGMVLISSVMMLTLKKKA
ncbi:MAG TPA: MFS transporter, partial [Spirochaetota bacterium]|nr:MFS transporter [Spirochaetota bacterium]